LFEQDPTVFALKATLGPDTLYYHEAMKEDDVPQFRTAMTKVVDNHMSKQQDLKLSNMVPQAGVGSNTI
jgi:hypothetical protein